jgi:peptidyl-prolyl cis-trans isomerase B (cyclophilin B)
MLAAAADSEAKAGALDPRRHAFGCPQLRTVKFIWASAPHTGGTVASSKSQEREAREARDRLKRYNARQTVHATQVKRRKRDNLIAVIGVVAVAALAGGVQFAYFSAGPGAPTPVPTASSSALAVPSPDLAEDREWTGTLTLNETPLEITLDGAAAPQGVASFVSDVQNGYFVGKTCHRLVVSEGANVIQCGSADGVGGSAEGYSYGPIENAPEDDLYVTGTIAVARQSNDADSNGHQFFIAFGDSTFPSDEAGGYTVIGKVTGGIDDLVTDIVSGGLTPGASGSTEDGSPTIPTTITAVTIK